MKLSSSILGLAAAALVSTTALAADLPARGIVKPGVAQPVFFWTGAYAGLGLGAQLSQNSWQTRDFTPALTPAFLATRNAGFNNTAFRFSGYAGYNHQMSQNVVIGVEADLGYGFGGRKGVLGVPGVLAGAYPANSIDRTSSVLGFDGSLRGRLGFLLAPTTMLYGTAGLAFQQASYRVSGGILPVAPFFTAHRLQSNSSIQMGWTVGAGVETALNSKWLARLDYRYSDFGRTGQTFFGGTADQVRSSTKLSTHNITLGVAYKF